MTSYLRRLALLLLPCLALLLAGCAIVRWFQAPPPPPPPAVDCFTLNGEPLSGILHNVRILRSPSHAPVYHFDAPESWIEVPDAAILHLPKFTFCAWVTPRHIDAGSTPTIFSTDDRDRGIRIEIREVPGDEQIVFGIGDGTNWITLHTDGQIREGRETHVAVSYDHTRLAIYLNGTLSAELLLPQPVQIVYGANPAAFGRNPRFHNQPFSGDLSGIQLFGRVLAQDEIRHAMTSPHPH